MSKLFIYLIFFHSQSKHVNTSYSSSAKLNTTTNFHSKKGEIFDMLATNKKDRMKIVEHKTTLKTKLNHLSEYNHRDNHKLLGTGNYIKQSLSNLKRSFKL